MSVKLVPQMSAVLGAVSVSVMGATVEVLAGLGDFDGSGGGCSKSFKFCDIIIKLQIQIFSGLNFRHSLTS